MTTAVAENKTETRNTELETNRADLETSREKEASKRRVVVPEYTAKNLENGYEIRVEIPGVREADLDITVKDRLLTVRGQQMPLSTDGLRPVYTELSDVDYAAGFRLSDDIDDEGINASLTNGLLTITLPKMEERMPRTIEVKAS